MWQNCALLEKIGIRMGYKDIKHLSVDNFNFTELWNASLYVHVYTFLWIKHIHTHTHTNTLQKIHWSHLVMMMFKVLMFWRGKSKWHVRMQTISWHAWLDVEDPGQVAPLPWGLGDVHVRLRVWVPGPHVTEHAPQLPHVAHPPLTAIKVTYT